VVEILIVPVVVIGPPVNPVPVAIFVTLPPLAIGDQVPSPRRYDVLDGVPVITGTDVTELITLPEIGSVNDVLAVTVKAVANDPLTVKLPPRVIVPVLLTPVPPLVAATTPEVICVPAIAIAVLAAAVSWPCALTV
jgi:hypothetical protein